MKRIVLVLGMIVLGTGTAEAITLQQATTEAHTWTVNRQEAILDRVMECIGENPRLCHTAWAASVTPNTDPADSALATVTLDDPGRFVVGPCSSCFTGEGTFVAAGISIPATAPLNAKINIAKGSGGWGAQLVIQIRYDGTLYQRGYGRGIFEGFPWEVVEE